MRQMFGRIRQRRRHGEIRNFGYPLRRNRNWRNMMREAHRKAKAVPQAELDVKIVTENSEKALAMAVKEYDIVPTPSTHERIVLWTDGSGPFPGLRIGGAAVVYKVSHGAEWITRAWHLTSCASSNACELFPVGQALEIALSEAIKWTVPDASLGARLYGIIVYTDSMAAIQYVGGAQFVQNTLGHPTLTKINAMVASLKALAATIEIRWVPGHRGVPGNVAADVAARRAAKWNSAWDLAIFDPALPVKVDGATLEVVSKDLAEPNTQPKPLSGNEEDSGN
jgi:ribonuclease HI